MKKIGIIDADLMDHGTRHPNLALMKIAGYYRDKGYEVTLIFKSYDEVKNYDQLFMGCVFNFTRVPEWVMQLPNIKYGGTGFFDDGGENLAEDIEHHKPYYDLYLPYVKHEIANGKKEGHFSDYVDYSIGFTTRGCFRKCSFCVNKKYDQAFLHSPVEEFLNDDKPYIYLWDDNILAYSQWEKVLDDLEATGKPFQFRQGLDLRLMTDEKAYRFVNAHYHGDFIFAFDHIEDKDLIVKKVQLWKRYSAKICKMYVISAYKSQDEKDIVDVFERIQTLMRYGSLPYIMRYEAYKISRYRDLYVQLARWCNQPQFFKKKSFREFCIANQEYKKDQSSNCSAYQAMLDFEREFPEIAQKYFDLRFDRENIYAVQYGYGRKYANKPLCEQCKKAGLCWDQLINDENKLIQAYLTKEIDLECLRYSNSECKVKSLDVAKIIARILLKTDSHVLIEMLRGSKNRERITQENIPQFSKLEDGIFGVSKILRNANKSMTFDDMGYYLKLNDPNSKNNEVALKKYGENHSKLAALMDLTIVSKSNSRAIVSLSEMGKYYCNLSNEDQLKLASKLCLRIPIVQEYFLEEDNNDIIDKNLSILSITTQKRRRSNVMNVIRSVIDNN